MATGSGVEPQLVAKFEDILVPFIVASLVETLLYGLHAALFAVCMIILYQNRHTTHWFIFTSAVALFVISTADIALTFRFFALYFSKFTFEDMSIKMIRLANFKNPLFVANNFVAELTMLYRCYMVWSQCFYVLVGASVLILANTIWGFVGMAQTVTLSITLDRVVLIYGWSIFGISTLMTAVTVGRIIWVAKVAGTLMGPKQMRSYNWIIAIFVERSTLKTGDVGIRYHEDCGHHANLAHRVGWATASHHGKDIQYNVGLAHRPRRQPVHDLTQRSTKLTMWIKEVFVAEIDNDRMALVIPYCSTIDSPIFYHCSPAAVPMASASKPDLAQLSQLFVAVAEPVIPYIIAGLVETLLYGAHVVLIVSCTHVLLRNKRSARWFILAPAIIMFLISTADIAITFEFFAHEVITYFRNPSPTWVSRLIPFKHPLFASNNLVAEFILHRVEHRILYMPRITRITPSQSQMAAAGGSIHDEIRRYYPNSVNRANWAHPV
ncbi:hypothetical protein CVT24_006982 [Panaeolus cyanescens]|uniref:Uncharacterized protein n=1 Tax=Panaeolus cyanescens TaxID=181874 RepID=A0A409W5H7_9AGAR|nr:hypothetical protein CVT24_006982 [Panaeolus cyanescens]